jgi:integrase
MSAANGSIRKRGNQWYIRTRVRVVNPDTGEQRWKQVEKAAGSSKKGAAETLKNLQAAVDEGAFVPSGLTVLELGRKWLKEHVQPNLKPSAAANYKQVFYSHVAPSLGSVRVDSCTPQMVKDLLGRKRAEGLSKETVAKIRRHSHAMFAFAIDLGIMTINPSAAPRKRGQKQRHRARGTALSPMQIKKLLDVCSPRWRAFFTVALDTGMRRGEMVGLRWGDIDLLERTISVVRSIGNYDRPDSEDLTTKTEAGERLVPILDGAQAALEALYTTTADTSDAAPVFATVERKRGRDGVLRPVGRPLSPAMVTRVFRKYAGQAGLPATIRLHDLRHTAITSAINQGEDILLIAAFAGHAKTSTTTDVYGHMISKRVGEAARRMSSPSHRTAHTGAVNVEDLHRAEAQLTTENPGNTGDLAS